MTPEVNIVLPFCKFPDWNSPSEIVPIELILWPFNLPFVESNSPCSTVPFSSIVRPLVKLLFVPKVPCSVFERDFPNEST